MIPIGGGRFVRPTCERCECELDALEPGWNYCDACSEPEKRGDAVHLCPFCGSDDITGDAWDQVGPTVSQVVDCLDCGETWIDSYQFVGFERVERSGAWE